MAAKQKSAENNNIYNLKAVIDIGATSIRMAVAQVNKDGTFQLLDSLSQSVAIGSDTFTGGRISTGTTEDCVKALRNFSTVLREYNIDLRKDIRAVATSAVREARNRHEFLDRITIATGINLEVIEGAEVNRLTFLGIQPLLKTHADLREGRLLVLEVGGGSTELMGLDDGSVSFAHSYRMGAWRLREMMDALHASGGRQIEVLETEIEAGVRQFREAVGKGPKRPGLLLMGGEARLAAKWLARDEEDADVTRLKVSDLANFAQRILSMDVDLLARKYHLTFEEAQTLGPTLQIYTRIAKAFGLKAVTVCNLTLRDGLMAEAASGNAWSEEFIEQILHSARGIGHRYQMDEKHSECVAEHSLNLFDALQNEHRLRGRSRVLLSVAALLHDVGMFISNTAHHKHSQYLIENSDIFGLGDEDIKLIALTARYHRRALPRLTHPDYNALPREDRLTVSKLAAILRVADALDRSHTQGTGGADFKLKEDQLVIDTGRVGGQAAERRALQVKGQMFEKVYGRTLVLRTRRKQR